MNYFHISWLLKFIEEREGKVFKIIRSKDYGIGGLLSFTAVVPDYFEVDKIRIIEDDYAGYVVEIRDKEGRDALTGPNIVFWDSELASAEGEENSYIWLEEIDNGVLVFDQFKNIPEFVSPEEFKEFVKGGIESAK